MIQFEEIHQVCIHETTTSCQSRFKHFITPRSFLCPLKFISPTHLATTDLLSCQSRFLCIF